MILDSLPQSDMGGRPSGLGCRHLAFNADKTHCDLTRPSYIIDAVSVQKQSLCHALFGMCFLCLR